MPCSQIVETDWRLLHRVLQNLLANAIRYTRVGGVLMGARRAGDRVRIQVVDTGIGISRKHQLLAFKEFQRFATGPDAERGLGLGLSIVQRISRVLDHPVSLRSQLGRGTVFTVEVPQSLAPPVATVARPPILQPTLGPERAAVLCIDNQRSILDGMQTLLTHWACSVRTATGQADMQALLERDPQPPDLVIADYHLDDGADGIACIEIVRRRFGADVPAILITADQSESLKAKAGACGLPVLSKPIKPAALRALMRRLLATRQAAE
jgi:CheY-like chemotaxis protein/anti-sigma regulatory factor (Ser/Thr protein kinase)